MNPESPDGIIILNKPSGWTSHDVVKKVRNLLGGVKVGHAGTLDPAATGVLVLLVGNATRESEHITGHDKRYRAKVAFGRSTDTCDGDGTTVATGDPESVKLEALPLLIQGLLGESEQLPPMYSAVKVNGKRLYKYARSGVIPERTPRKIRIDRIETDCSGFPVIDLDISCSKGTYIRELANRLGELTGCPSHLSALCRTASGPFVIEDAVTLDELKDFIGRGDVRSIIRPVPDRNQE